MSGIADLARRLTDLESELVVYSQERRFQVHENPVGGHGAYVQCARSQAGTVIMVALLSHLIECDDATHHAPIPKMFLSACRKEIDALARELRRLSTEKIQTVTAAPDSRKRIGP